MSEDEHPRRVCNADRSYWQSGILQDSHGDARLQGDPDVDFLPQRRLERCLLLLQRLLELPLLRRQALQQLRDSLLGGLAGQVGQCFRRSCITVC